MKTKLTVLLVLITIISYSQQTYVPDNNFEQALINLGYDTVLDDYVTTANISNITYLNVYNKSITDLTGIEDFVALTSLNCDSNQLTTIDLSQNTALIFLLCYGNLLTSLDLSQNTALTNLDCRSNLLTSLDLSQNTALTYLTCSSNLLTSLDLSQNTALTTLFCDDNQLTSLDITQNIALTSFSCQLNQLTNMDLSQNTALSYLNCAYNQLTSLDMSQNTALVILYCYDNQLTRLDMSQNTVLENLWCHNNQLKSLDVKENTSLTNLSCYSNQLTSLNVSQNTALTDLSCYDNQFSRLNVKNGNNTNFISFNAGLNPNLLCIEVDDVSYSTTNWIYIDAQTSFSQDCMYQTFVPDDNFEQALIDLGYDTVLDNYVATANIINVHSLDVSGKSIADLTGIQDFDTLTNLDCSGNQITSLNMSQNAILSNLSCYDNQLIRLYVKNGNNTNFTAFDATNNPNLFCIEVDNAAYSTANWTNIDAQSGFNTDCLYQTYIPDDNFEQTLIDLGYDTVLDDYVTTANISNIPSLDVNSKSIADLTGIQDFMALKNLNCSFNQITSLDVTQNKVLTTLNCFYNQLTRLYVNNGNNINFTAFSASYNPNLYCITVDNATYSTTNWTDIDAQTTFSEDCMYPEYTYIPDDNFEIALIYLGYDTSLDDYVNTANINGITSLDISGNNISDLTGIQDFVALTNLNCSYNQLISLDVSQNTALTNLNCYGNQLTSLDVSQNSLLNILYCGINLITSLDLTQNTALTELDCFDNKLTSLNLKNGYNTNITVFLAFFNPDLFCIDVDNESYSTTNWSYGIDIQMSFSEDCSALSIDDNEIQDIGFVYPNPTSNYINIKSKTIITKIEVFDLLGKRILTNNIQNHIDVSHLQSGIYLVKIYSENGQETKRFIKQ